MVWKFLSDEGAATAIEYGLIAMVIGVAIVLASSDLGAVLQQTWGKAATRMEEVGTMR